MDGKEVRLVRVTCRECVLGTVRVRGCMGSRSAPCPKCGGKGYWWEPHIARSKRDDFEFVVDGLTVELQGL
jgi:hypothetical protein